jgi:hypothetical protein
MDFRITHLTHSLEHRVRRPGCVLGGGLHRGPKVSRKAARALSRQAAAQPAGTIGFSPG